MTRRSLFPIWLLTLAIFARGLVPWVHSPVVSTAANGGILLTFCGSVSPALLAKAAAISPWKQDQSNPGGTPAGSAAKICPICVVAATAVLLSALVILHLLRGSALLSARPAAAKLHSRLIRRYHARGPPARILLSI